MKPNLKKSLSAFDISESELREMARIEEESNCDIAAGMTDSQFMDSVKFQPPQEELKPVGELLATARVSKGDVDAAIAQWLQTPPDPEYTNLPNASDNA